MPAAKSGVSYGESGTWKTTQAKFFARYIYKKYGKTTRLISCDGGGWAPCEPEVRAGLIEAYRVPFDKNPLPILRKLSKGYWPTIYNKQTSVFDKTQGKLVVKSEPALRLIETTDWSGIGGYFIEGWTSIGDTIMGDLIREARRIGEEPVGEWMQSAENLGITEDDAEKFSGASRAHYNFVQNELYRLHNGWISLPVEYVWVTALEAKGEDKITGETVYGPSIPGKQAIAKAPAWVGSCLHHDSYSASKIVQVPSAADPKIMVPNTVQETKTRIWFVRHLDTRTNIPYPAKPRVPTDQWAAFLKKWPGGYFEPTTEHGLDEYLQFEDELISASASGVEEWKKSTDAARDVETVPVPNTSKTTVPAPAAPPTQTNKP